MSVVPFVPDVMVMREPRPRGVRLGIRPRVASLIAALLLIPVYLLPLWNIRLVAPQYPEGLGMRIGVRSITGVVATDLDNINGLNHYIGMKPIHPDAIPELRYMPWIVAGLIAGGVLTALTRRRAVLLAWAGIYAAAALAGLADFWRWERDYGHDLDLAHAIIKIPGMDYQPPLIGSRQLLNFTATSWPGAGGWIAGLSLVLVACALAHAFRQRPAA